MSDVESNNPQSFPGPAGLNPNLPPATPQPTPPTSMREQVQKEVITPSGFFTGFDISYPEYEVLTPQTLLTFTIRSMTVSDEEKLKSSLVTPKKIPMYVNDIIWSCLVKKPDCIKTKEDFINKLTPSDRDVLLYALYHITYKDVREYNITCSNCSNDNTYPIKFNISDIFEMKAYNGNPLEILNDRHIVDLELAKNAKVVLKVPVLADEQKILNDMLFQSDTNIEIASSTNIIEKFIIISDQRNPQEVNGKENIFNAYKSLPAKDRHLLENEYHEKFGKFKMRLPIKSSCPKCNHTNEMELDLIQQLFRSLYE